MKEKAVTLLEEVGIEGILGAEVNGEVVVEEVGVVEEMAEDVVVAQKSGEVVVVA